MTVLRRHLLLAATGAAATALSAPVLASSRRALTAMTDGPFYPPRSWRESWADQDADLTRVQRDGRVLQARGEHLGLELGLADTKGRVIDGAEIEIWQCDSQAHYRHPRVPARPGAFDEGFQGYGATHSDSGGRARLRTIRPVAYPGRTPHIHIKLRHASFGELSSQLFVAGDPGNAGDFLWRAVPAADRAALEMRLGDAQGLGGLRWTTRHLLTVPA